MLAAPAPPVDGRAVRAGDGTGRCAGGRERPGPDLVGRRSGHDPGAGRPRRHGGEGGVPAPPRRGADLRPVLEQRGRRGELGAVRRPQRRQAQHLAQHRRAGRAGPCSTTCCAGPTSWSTRSRPAGRATVGLDDARVRALNPTIVNMSVTLFGLDGPLAELAGYGNLGAALAGCYDITGWPDRAPAGPYLAYTDYTSAHLMLVTVMAALLHRRRTGEGQFVELSQSETALQFLAPRPARTPRSPARAVHPDGQRRPRHGPPRRLPVPRRGPLGRRRLPGRRALAGAVRG